MPYNICMVCDFFYPNIGGVESHIYQLSQRLIHRGHKVIVVTHSYENRRGIRNMYGNLKVYYLPFRAFYKQCIFPTVLGTLPLIREIVIREQIDIIHGHSSFSTLAHEALFHAAVLEVRAVFTDHSLFGFADLSSVLTNNVLKFSLNSINHTICVSNTARENTVLRSHLHPVHVSVIPNAIDASQFRPDLSKRDDDRIVIVVMSRLVYRRGTDLLISIIPYICSKYPNAHFLIGGDGDKRVLLEQIKEQHDLHGRMKLLGMVKNENVREVMVQGHIFVNTSLTESFCISILEAASCGLKVVTTNVGGIPEVLPPDMVKLASPNAESLAEALEQAMAEVRDGVGLSPLEQYDKIKDIYKWSDVARRTEIVYDTISKQPLITPKCRINKLWRLGMVFGKIVVMVLVLDVLLCAFLDWWRPKSSIDRCPYIYTKYSPTPPTPSTRQHHSAAQTRSNDTSETFTPRRSSRVKQRTKAFSHKHV